MNIGPDQIRAVYHCLAIVRRGLMPGCSPRWLGDLFDMFDAEVRRLDSPPMSGPGHNPAGSACDRASSEQQLLSGRQAAGVLGVTSRQVRRLHADLGAVQVDGRWLFDRSIVESYREIRRDDGT